METIKFLSLAVRVVTVLGVGRRGGFLAEAAVAAIQGGGHENGESLRKGDNEIELMVLEGQKKKAANEDNNKTTVMVESRILKAENETSAKGNKAPKAFKSINAKKPKQPKVTKIKSAKKPKANKSNKGVKPSTADPIVIVELSLPPL